MQADYLIIGAGIIGAALAAELGARRPQARIIVAEKESAAALHQTGRNSGVVHSGVYYAPDSLKARFCREGLAQTKAFCARHDLGYQERGKLLVACSAKEEKNLERLERRARDNQVEAQPLGKAELRAREPRVSGQAALRIPASAITDYGGITRALLAQLENNSGQILFNAPLLGARRQGDTYLVKLGAHRVRAAQIITCSGLASDRVARLLGLDPGIRILPFKGEYFVLPARHNKIVSHLIYPVPDPALPFLGVHLTPMIDGSVTVGPNAVLALAREKYTRFGFDLPDAISALGYPGLWRMLARHPRATFDELRGSLFKSVYLRAVRKYCPSLQLEDLSVYRCANRAQALKPDGSLVDDFLIRRKDGITAILNAPSPAATAAMPIAAHIADLII